MTFITRETVAEKFAAYLRHELPLDSLVAWAESALMGGEFDPARLPTIRDVSHTERGKAVRIISVRPTTRHERKRHET